MKTTKYRLVEDFLMIPSVLDKNKIQNLHFSHTLSRQQILVFQKSMSWSSLTWPHCSSLVH